jgi:hypothetical protein
VPPLGAAVAWGALLIAGSGLLPASLDIIFLLIELLVCRARVALLDLLLETMSALRAVIRNELQKSLNLALARRWRPSGSPFRRSACCR